MTSLELLMCLLLVFASGYISSSEIALFSLSRFQIRAIKDRAKHVHKKIKRLLADPGGLLLTITIVNEIINISLSSTLTEIMSRNRKSYLPDTGNIPEWAVDVLLGLLVITPIVLIVCEITPKVVGARANRLIANLAAGPMLITYKMFHPVRVALKRLLELFGRKPATVEPDKATILKEADFMLLIEEGHKEGAIKESEVGLIRNVFELDDTKVSEIFTPLNQVKTLGSQSTLKSALTSIKTATHARIPVLSADRKQIIGILYSKDLLRAKLNPEFLDRTIGEIVRRPVFVTPDMRLNLVFRRLKQTKTHLAVVQSPNGIALGIVTMKDIFDTLFEDLFPEIDTDDTQLIEERGN